MREFPIDNNDPMNGIIKFLRASNLMSFISATESSNCTLYKASDLLKQEESVTFQFNNWYQIGEYFEIHLLKSVFVALTGYGFIGTTENCAIPRNWNVSCMSTNPPTLLANEVDNKNLCPNSDGSGCVGCQTSEKKAYGCSKINVPCTNIRFTTTGRTAFKDNWKAFALSGIELLGKLIKGEEHTFTHNDTLRTELVLIFCFIYS